MIVVGGVPGAGKSTAMRPHVGRRGVVVLDPDQIRARVRMRWLVHLVHQVLVWAAVLAGPRRTPVLLIQDTATRPRRREALLRAARWRGWDVRLVLVQVARSEALEGQRQRGRISPSGAFARHWHRWQDLLDDLDGVSVAPQLIGRDEVGPLVADLVAGGLGEGLQSTEELSHLAGVPVP